MPMLGGFLAFMVFMAFILALWEIQIEGGDGWGGQAPGVAHSKRLADEADGWRSLLTGYHIFMTLFLLGLIHLPLFFTAWTWRLEFCCWDFTWEWS